MAARALLIAVGLGLWFFTQSLIGSREMAAEAPVAARVLTRSDGLFGLLEPIHRFLDGSPGAADALLIVSSAGIDLLGLFIIASAIAGSTFRPFLGLIAVFALRQLAQAACPLPPPEGMIWRFPGVPSALVTYGVANDFFFSGHTAIAFFGAAEIARRRFRGAAVLGAAVAVFEAGAVLALRAHYTMDVLAGAAVALFVAAVIDLPARRLDRWLERRMGCPGSDALPASPTRQEGIDHAPSRS
jgi:membrane-associated phospholipid phosphatase